MLEPLMSPCTIGGAQAWRYWSAEPTSMRGFVRVDTRRCSPLCAALMKPSMHLPSTYSKIIARSALVGSITAAWNETMFGWRTRRRSRSSLQSAATFVAPGLAASTLGSFTATAEPRKMPMATQPKPPNPRRIGELGMATSAVETIQCSRAPMVTSCWNFSWSSMALSPERPFASRSMSLKICSVLLELAMLGASQSDRQPWAPSSPMFLAEPPAVVRVGSSAMADRCLESESR
mmetsp:Transcript_29447/g.85507  ORF Transcript_29447/g.85507 Transcript_29447/m.85507 type:complete len:234 (+) Transcript_29447:215-916(+)